MTVKMTGLEYKAFLDDDAWWPKGSNYDDAGITFNGVIQSSDGDISTLLDTDIVGISGGGISGVPEDDLTYETFCRRWLKARATATFVVECQKDRADAVRAAVKAAGGRLIEARGG